METAPRYQILKLFDDIASTSRPVYLCAPMVRYSKLAFRKLVRKYKADVAFTPMIIAKSFGESSKCRDAEFSTDNDDGPLVVQFAANNGPDLVRASQYIQHYSDGIDINCGCPQKWALAEGYGSKLISQPDLIADMVHHAKRNISNPDYTVSVKIRIHNNLSETVDLCRKAESAGKYFGVSKTIGFGSERRRFEPAGADFLTVHGRTPKMRHEPVVTEAFKTIKDSLRIPVFANGDIKSVLDAEEVCRETGVDGVMTARAILHNPALFAGYDSTPPECVQDWLNFSLGTGMHFTCFHHHLMFMLDRHLTKAEKKIFNRLQSVPAVLDYLEAQFSITASN